MEYRKLGKTGLNVSVIGLGTEHLIQETTSMEDVLRTAVDAGVNYIDLVWNHKEFWIPFEKALKQYRKHFNLALHWGTEPNCNIEKYQKSFEDNLKRVGGFAEVVIFTFVDTEHMWNGMLQDSLKYLNQYKKEGKIGAIGIATHRTPMAIKAAESKLFDLVMTRINIAGHNSLDLKKLYNVCEQNQVGLIAMKVYRGGTLFSQKNKIKKISPVKCLHYVITQPVSATVPGVKNAAEYKKTLEYNSASPEEKDYSSIIEHINLNIMGECVFCKHCHPCKKGIDIAGIHSFLEGWQFLRPNELLEECKSIKVKPSNCNECKVCVSRCPYNVDIPANMKTATKIIQQVLSKG